MVYEDVPLDIVGVPEKIPNLFYRRLPLYITKADSYDDWKRRRGKTHRLLQGVENELSEIKLEVNRIVFERALRARPPVQEENFKLNKKVVEILKGEILRYIAERRIARESFESRAAVQGEQLPESDKVGRIIPAPDNKWK
jgi:hypothetical protein